MKTSSSGCAGNAVRHTKPQLLGRAQRERLTLWSSRQGQMCDSQSAVSTGVLPEQTKTCGSCDRVDPAVVPAWPRWALRSGGESRLRDAQPERTHRFSPAGSHPNLGHPPQSRDGLQILGCSSALHSGTLELCDRYSRNAMFLLIL